ncbi:MAG: ATP-binding cassette domain-containing protein [Lentisphaerota bacterium]
MGGSGVGKSTLINILNGELPPSAGEIRVNGLDLYARKSALEGVIGYVPQEDLLFDDLTVFENLDYNARLCLANLDAARRELSRLDYVRNDLIPALLLAFQRGARGKR